MPEFSIRRIAAAVLTGLVTVAAVFALSFCSRDAKEEPVPALAEIGSYQVSDEEFLGAFRNVFERSGRALNVTPTLLREILDQRVNFYAAVQYGVDNNWHEDHEGTYQKNLIYRQVMMDEFKRQHIARDVSIEERDLQDLFLRYNTHLRASHLYAPDRETADSLYQLVAEGVPFEQLAADIFESQSLRESGGDLGYFTVDDMDIGFEYAAFSLPVGEISEPVRTTRGFSIIKVTDRITTPIITEYQYAENRQRIRELAVQQKTELRRRSHMDEVIDGFRFDQELVDALWEQMDGLMHLDPVADVELGDFRSRVPADWHDRVIGSYNGFELTVGTFLQEAYFTPLQNREQIRSDRSFRNLVEGVAYRAYAIQAYQNGPSYDETEVALSVENTFQNYLNRRLYQALKEQAQIAESAKRQEFETNRRNYVHPREVNLAELAVRDMDTAEEAYLAIRDGMSFRDALEKYGFDEEAKLAGGEIGYTPVTHFGTISPSLANIQPGEIAGPFEMQSDVIFLFKCLGVREAHPMTFEEAQPLIAGHLTEEFVMGERKRIIQETLDRHDARIHYERISDVELHL
ncbi:MAG: peptidyl-prolyl cis-trans isomerase [Balneolaceae bacterium]|nr:MAG: peptidyl-prolyl cis-trans isomerase [Balneolaceae bacterium]